eukprot:m.20397 g.20397  ORF g.20397 m.20397 type:complete len:898 (-) comp6840_c0_seq1:73-2766(-)
MGVLQDLNRGLLLFSVWVDKLLTSSFKSLGKSINARPWLYIIVPVLVCGAGAVGFMNIELESDDTKLYVPQSSPAFDIRDYYDAVYGQNIRIAVIYATGDPNGENIATKEALLGLFDIHESVEDVEAKYDGETYTLQDVCIKKAGRCVVQSVLEFWQYNITKLREDPDPMATLATNATDQLGRTLLLEELAGTDVVVENGRVTQIRCYRMQYELIEELVVIDGVKQDPETVEFELAMHNKVTGTDYPGLVAYIDTSAFAGEEAEAAITGDLNLIFLGIIFLVFYAIVVLSRRNLVHSHGSLTLWSALAVGLSIAGAFGLSAGIGVKFSLVVNAAIFLLFGLGMDDTFVLVSAFMDPDVRTLEHEERIEKALGRAGASITITSVTDLIAFLAGSNSEIPAIQVFCYYAAIGVTFDFMMQVTFFVSIMIMSAKREENGKYDILCCVKADEKNLETVTCGTRDFDNDKPGPMRYFIGEIYGPFLMRPYVKAFVLVFTAALLAFSGWAYTTIEVDFDIDSFIPLNSYLQDVYDIRDQYYAYNARPVYFLTKEADYDTQSSQQLLQEFTNDLNNDDEIIPGSCQNFWPVYYTYVEENFPSDMINATTDGPLTTVINPSVYYSRLLEFLNTTEGSVYVTQFAEMPTTSGIKGFKIDCWNPSTDFSVQVAIDEMENMREIAEKSFDEFGTVAYSMNYFFMDGLKIVREQIFVNIGYAIMGVAIVCVILLGGLFPSLIVLTMIVCIDVEVFGSFYYYGVTINYVSAINLVVAVGLSVDANAHVAHAFLSAEGTKNERVLQALDEIGPAVANGLISTLLVLLPLGAAQSYIFQIFLRCFLSIIIHSMFHGLCVLPVVLSLIGPDSYAAKKEQLNADKTAASDSQEKTVYDAEQKQSPRSSVVKMSI